MIAGEFDLSIGSMIGFAGLAIAIPSVIWGWPVWASILFAFAVAVLVGYLNGAIVVQTGLPSFIVTLGSPVHAARPGARAVPADHRPHAGFRHP